MAAIRNQINKNDVKELIQFAIPHDFGETLSYISKKLNMLRKVVVEEGPIARQNHKYQFYKRVQRIQHDIDALEIRFTKVWNRVGSREGLIDTQVEYERVICPLLDDIIEQTDQVERLIERILMDKGAFSADKQLEADVEAAIDSNEKIRYFSNRCKYYVPGLIELLTDPDFAQNEKTNLNKFFRNMDEFFGISGTPEEIVLLNPMPTLAVDHAHCYALFSNLIKNSLKYKRLDTVSISVLFEDGGLLPHALKTGLPGFVPLAEAADDKARLHFIDNGSGIAAGELDNIFDAFRRGVDRESAADIARRRAATEAGKAYSDLGIGLAIAKRVVDHYDGAISASSTLGCGTCITISLPKSLVR